MKHSKKIVSLLLALAMVFTLAACGTSKPKDPAPAATPSEPAATKTEGAGETPAAEGEFAGKTLVFAGLEGGYGIEGWKKVIADFEAMTGAKVEATFAPNVAEVVRPQIQAGEGPDVLYYSVGGVGGLTETLIKEKMLMDITDVLSKKVPGEEKTVSEKLIPGFTDTYITNPYGDGKTYLAPLFYGPTGLWYNAGLFKDGGGKYDLPKDMDAFIALGETAKADGIGLFTYPTSGYFDGFIASLINVTGGPDLYNKLMNYDEAAWANEATPVFETIGKIAPYLESNTVSQANATGFTKNQQAVIDSKALFMPNGNWVVGEMKEGTLADFKWGFTAIPPLKAGGDAYAYTFFEQVEILKDAKEPELAKEFVAYLYSDAAVKTFFENGGTVQPVIDAEKNITDETTKMIYSIYADGAKAAMGGFAAAPAVEGVSMSDALYTAIDSVMNGEMTVADWQAGVVNAAKELSAAIKAGQ